MMGIWDFIQNQILGMRWLHDLVGAALSGLSLDINTKIGGSIHFFIYDIIGSEEKSVDIAYSIQ